MKLCNTGALHRGTVAELSAAVMASVSAWPLERWLSIVGFLFAAVTFYYGRKYSAAKRAEEARLAALDERLKELEIEGFVRRRTGLPSQSAQVGGDE